MHPTLTHVQPLLRLVLWTTGTSKTGCSPIRTNRKAWWWARLLNCQNFDVARSRVTCSESIQFLGVSINSGLTCNRRINNIISACNYQFRALTQIWPALNMNVAFFGWTCDHTFTTGLLCNALLSRVSEANIARLQCFQNRLVMAVMKLQYHSHVSDTWHCTGYQSGNGNALRLRSWS